MATIKFKYRNHRGEISDRKVSNVELIYDYGMHPEFGYMQPGWYIFGFDEDKGHRQFALHNIVIPEHPPSTRHYSIAFPREYGLPIS